MTRYLVTGGAGFIGSHLCDALLGRGDSVVAIDDLSTGNLANVKQASGNPNYKFVVAPVQVGNAVNQYITGCDAVIHLAAAVGVRLVMDEPVRTISINVDGTANVLRIAAARHVPVLLASTSEVYGKSTHIPFRENDDLLLGPTHNHRWSYAVSKLVDEHLGLAYHREFGLPVTVFRLFNTVGPRQTGYYGMVLPRFVAAALLDEPLVVYGDGLQERCFCHVQDTVEAIISLADEPTAPGRVYNVGTEVPISILSLAERVIEWTGSKSEIVFKRYEDAYPDGFEDMRRRQPDTTRIRELTGWEPEHSLYEIVQDVIGWMEVGYTAV